MNTSRFFQHINELSHKRETNILIYISTDFNLKKWWYSVQYSDKDTCVVKSKSENNIDTPEYLMLLCFKDILKLIVESKTSSDNINNNIIINTDAMYLKMLINDWIVKWRKTKFITDSNTQRPNYQMLLEIDNILIQHFSFATITCKYTKDCEIIKNLKL